MKIKEDSKYKRKTRISELKKITPFAYNRNDELLTIKEQNCLQQRARNLAGLKYQNFPFIVMETTKELNIKEFNNQPLIITRKDIKHIIKKHGKMKNNSLDFNNFLDLLENLTEEIQNNQIAFQLTKNPNRFCFVLPKKSENNNNLISIVEINKDNFSIKVSEVITLFGKEMIMEMINDTIEYKYKIYTNKRTGDWLAQFRDTLFLTNGKPFLCATKQYLLNLYYKQNKVDNQEIPTNKQTKSYSSATRDPIASNKQVASDNPNNRSIDKQR